jgi:hypothetical protein
VTEVWTHTTWVVKDGSEEDFIAAWRDLVADVKRHVDPGVAPRLLRDHDRPTVFVSFAPWSVANAGVNFRTSEIFNRHVGQMSPLLERFEPQTLDEVVRGG